MSLVIIILFLSYLSKEEFVCDPSPGTDSNKPLGVARGIHPGRVVWDHNPSCCTWDGKTEYWWYQDYVNNRIVETMLENVLLKVTGEKTQKNAWDKTFRFFNKIHFQEDEGYKEGEKIAIKVNLNTNIGYTTYNNENGPSPQFLKELVRSLVVKAGIDEKNIYLYDCSRWFQPYYWEEPTGLGKEFPNINIVDAEGGLDYVEMVELDPDIDFTFSDEKVYGRYQSKLPKVLTAAKYLIVLNGFRGHDLAGITATGKNFFGSIYRPDINCSFTETGLPGHWCPMSLHGFVNVTGIVNAKEWGGDLWQPRQEMGSYNALVDLLGHDHTSNGKGLIFFTDGLYGGTMEYGQVPIKFESKPFNNHWSSSIFASLDPIALDSVVFDILRNEPVQPFPTQGCTDNYLHESALANDPPSKIQYRPSGKKLDSLGVHEHWNSNEKKQYTRNLGNGEGIELIVSKDLPIMLISILTGVSAFLVCVAALLFIAVVLIIIGCTISKRKRGGIETHRLVADPENVNYDKQVNE